MYRDRNIHNYKHVACISYRSETQVCSIYTGPVTVSIVGNINSHFQYEGIVHACIEEFSSWWIPTIDKDSSFFVSWYKSWVGSAWAIAIQS